MITTASGYVTWYKTNQTRLVVPDGFVVARMQPDGTLTPLSSKETASLKMLRQRLYRNDTGLTMWLEDSLT